MISLPPISILRDTETGQPLLGCGNCIELKTCGGLETASAGLHNCLDTCCGQPLRCDQVCPKAPQRFAKRFREVGGFDLLSVGNVAPVQRVAFPKSIPLINGKQKWSQINLDHVGIPFSTALVNEGRRVRARTAAELISQFGVKPASGWILCGIEQDTGVERVWKAPNRVEIFQGLRAAGVVFATTPNFSLYADAPRYDNMHAMKRIALVWHDIASAGIDCALHVNGRTARDFDRWIEFLNTHPEISSIAFEFLTGPKYSDISSVYVERLRRIVDAVHRPLRLIFRGRWIIERSLREIFDDVVTLDAEAYMKTISRQSIHLNGPQVFYKKHSTNSPQQLAELFKSNLNAIKRHEAARAEEVKSGQLKLTLTQSTRYESGNDETGQLDLFAKIPTPSVNSIDDGLDPGVAA